MTQGFSLTELLIALVILGEISAFAIPKILNAQQNGQQRAVMKEAYSALSEAWYTGFITGELTEANVSAYLRSKINAVKTCTDGIAQGCWPSGASINWANDTTLVLHNGAVITIDSANQAPGNYVHGIVIDANGSANPNLVGQDQLELTGNIGTYTDWSTKPGQIYHNTAFGDLNQYQALFSN